MTALLVFRNDTAPLMEWTTDIKARMRKIGAGRTAFVDALVQAAPDVAVLNLELGSWSRGEQFVGVEWPPASSTPKGWRRDPDNSRAIIPHRTTRIGKAAAAEMEQLTWPDVRRELSQQFGMPSLAIPPMTSHYFTPGVRPENDGVWVTWGTRDILPELGNVEDHGWVRVPLTEYIERFGEDAL